MLTLFLEISLLSLLLSCSVQFFFWVLHLRYRNAGYVDLGWAMSVGLTVSIALVAGNADFAKRLLLCLFPLVWSVRLSIVIASRLTPGQQEDGRYTQLRDRLGKKFPLLMLPFFLFQALLAVVLSLPVLYAVLVLPAEVRIVEALGVLLMLVALLGETTADLQLKAFTQSADRGDGVCRQGLWAYSRHPNYFFEWVFWVGLGLFCAQFSLVLLFSILSPLIMFILLTRVTGIPPTEALAIKKRPQAYGRYQAEVSPFFPWFPSRKA
jgi:steroid 5-alpha reductase family enzyme